MGTSSATMTSDMRNSRCRLAATRRGALAALPCGSRLNASYLEQQPLASFDQRQSQQRPQPPVAQTEPASLAEAVRRLLVALLAVGEQAGQKHSLPQRVVELPLSTPAGIHLVPPLDGVVVDAMREAEMAEQG